MRTTYIKSEHLHAWEIPSYFKIVERSEDETSVITLDAFTLEKKKHIDNYKRILSFVVNVVCKSRYKVIKRSEFDEKYKTYVNELNELAKC